MLSGIKPQARTAYKSFTLGYCSFTKYPFLGIGGVVTG